MRNTILKIFFKMKYYPVQGLVYILTIHKRGTWIKQLFWKMIIK